MHTKPARLCFPISMPVQPRQPPDILLFDNGSLRPEPTLRLRRVARLLAPRVPSSVTATSLLHSDRVDPDQLECEPAVLLLDQLERRHRAGQQSRFIILPFFIGPSLALTDYLPNQLNDLRTRHPQLSAVMADSLARTGSGEDLRLAAILSRRVRTASRRLSHPLPPDVIVVDHGSPVREVALLRDRIAFAVGRDLGSEAHSVRPASMERRDGPEFAFNDPLLKAALTATGHEGRPIIVSLLFLAPGRHAGPDGDITRICQAAQARMPGTVMTLTEPVGDDPVLIDILADRVREVWPEE